MNDAEQEEMAALITGSHGMWLGGTLRNDKWTWEPDGRPVEYQSFARGQGRWPKGDRGQPYMCVGWGGDSKWHDCHGRNEKFPVICKVGGGLPIKEYGGWSFAKVPTSDTSDKGIIAACKAAGMKVPCAGSDSCHYTNKAHCVVTSEVGCGNPMYTTARQSGCSRPSGCPAFKNVYTYMGSKWVTRDGQKAGCGTNGRGWCTQGSPKMGGFAFCAKSTSKKKYSGNELGSHGGWTFYKVPTKDTSDQGTLNACKNAGLVVPCTGAPGCRYNNNGKECTQTSEKGCGNPMSTTSKASCGGKWPRDCDKFDNTFAFMGKVWAGGNACGTKGRSWCTVGKKTMAGFAFCAQQTR